MGVLTCVGTIWRQNRQMLMALNNTPELRCQKCWARGLCGGDCWLIRWDYASEERIERCNLICGLGLLELKTFLNQASEKVSLIHDGINIACY